MTTTVVSRMEEPVTRRPQRAELMAIRLPLGGAGGQRSPARLTLNVTTNGYKNSADPPSTVSSTMIHTRVRLWVTL